MLSNDLSVKKIPDQFEEIRKLFSNRFNGNFC